jgi:uncharacterized membrane protein YvbJ
VALINCTECNKEISENSAACIGCGAPIAAKQPKKGDFIPYTDQEVSVMLSKKKNTSHILHLLLSLVTAGIWIIMWLLIAISNSSVNSKIDATIKKGKKFKR